MSTNNSGAGSRTGPATKSSTAQASDLGVIVSRPGDGWAGTFDAARYWVAWTARRRWPHHAANDQIWAMSVASWWRHGPGRGGRDD